MTHASITTHRPTQRGFTLLEVLIASVILSMAVAAISQAIVSGQSHTWASLDRMRGAALGQALMEEITCLPYEDPAGATAPGPEKGEKKRQQFNCMDDFHDYVESPGKLADQAGQAYDAPYQKFTRKAAAAYKTMTIAGLGDVKGLEITVTVTDDHGRSWQLVRFVPQPPPESSEATASPESKS